MKNKPNALILTVLLMLLLLSSCNLPRRESQPIKPEGPNAIQTAAALTVEAFANQQGETSVPNANETAVQPTDIPPTETAKPTTPSSTEAPGDEKPCDRAAFVTDVTVPDGTEFEPGEDFKKTWRLKNDGTCTWSTSYALVFADGNAMNGPVSFPMPENVAPGETIDLSVNLTAPSKPDTYRGNWRLRNASGAVFGIGTKADKPFYVEIAVDSPVFAVVSATTRVDQKTFTGACPHKFNFEADIKVTDEGKVTYHWERSDGASSSTETIKFTEAGQKTVTTSWNFGGAGNTYTNYWIRLYIDEPNHQYFPKAVFTLNCNP